MFVSMILQTLCKPQGFVVSMSYGIPSLHVVMMGSLEISLHYAWWYVTYMNLMECMHSVVHILHNLMMDD
jgi:hypothetical protein